MPSLPHPEDIREMVLRTFGELLRRAIAPADIIETVLLRQGCYYGRAYRQGPLLATLTAETGTLCFYRDQGQLLRSIDLAAMNRAVQKSEGSLPLPAAPSVVAKAA